MIERARSLSVLAIVLGGGLGLIAATQTWLNVVVDDGANQALEVTGSAALPLLTPLSLAAMALGVVLSLAGRILRYVFGVIAVIIGAALLVQTIPLLTGVPLAAVAPAITAATGISGDDAVSALVGSVTLTAWPIVALVAWVLLVVSGVFVLLTGSRWRTGSSRYRSGAPQHHAEGPLDAVDSWDELSRGDDPTS
ncbi:Trp biosynthesis-associated membrane protein [Microbacterium nymphoidis]|uniref:Trp biosynthesis-associated membrane protein n=1 Tax=Microbacterium nymphoidis TaxID=2898586 RepID=UPI001E4D6E20|nr:Trp biosynthesis-associated membrane protein [Microbacterium nymphoidis]MCD2497412.1 Trp biosynthesis-associated membrane protein [Microbacterium nymphoidis]